MIPFQVPCVDTRVRTNTVSSVHALLRWPYSRRMSPVTFQYIYVSISSFLRSTELSLSQEERYDGKTKLWKRERERDLKLSVGDIYRLVEKLYVSFLESFGTTLTLKKFSLRWRPPQRRPRYFIIGRWGSYRGFAGNTFGLWFFFPIFFESFSLSSCWRGYRIYERERRARIATTWVCGRSTRPPLSSGYLFIDEKASCHRDTDVRRQRAGKRRDTSGRCRRRGEGWTFSRVERVYRTRRQLAEDRG